MPEQERLVPALAELAKDFHIKTVATNDAHYLKREHAAAHDVLLCVGTQSQRDTPDRMKFFGDQFYFKSPKEMAQNFTDFPEALDTTLEVAEKCKLEIPLNKRHYPVYQLPDEPGLTADIHLAMLAREGLKKRFGDTVPEDAAQRLETELKVITQTGFADYFLIVADFVRWAKENDVPVGPGRGSAAGSMVSYALGITNLDPIKYGLLFERFLNPERVTPPDIDIDFSDDKRERVISYVREKYGRDSVCRITTFGRMATRSAVRDVARAMGLSYADGDKIARLIPEAVKEMTIGKALSEVSELKNLIQSNPRYGELVAHVRLIEGAIRHSSTHAAGVVICPAPTIQFLPIYKLTDEDEIYTQYDMNWMDAVGLLKMDFLGLQTLQELDLTVKALRRKGVEIDLDNIPLDDLEVFKLFGDGDTIGIFQFESGGMRDNLIKLKPDRLEDLTAMNALYRPGPMQMVDEYIACRHGRKKVEYLHPRLEPILKDTYGVIVYQEQVMRIATDLAGFSLGKADTLRWAMGKKKMELMKSLEVEFIEGCINGGIPRRSAEAIYLACEQFAHYGFVKAHSAGYALIAYQCAYLKRYYPADFLAACLTVRSRHSEQVMKLLAECRNQSVPVLAPDINESDSGFTATQNGIRFGMAAVKNVGEAAVAGIVAAREKAGAFASFVHFMSEVDLRVVNRKVVESLVDAGAFDSLGPNRASLLASLPSATAYAQAIQEERIKGQTTFFGGGGETAIVLPPPQLHYMDEWPPSELQSREKAVLGYYISSHPLSQYAREISSLATHTLSDKDEFNDGQKIKLCGVVTSLKTKLTKTGDRMAVILLEDLTGAIECLVFPTAFKQYSAQIQTDSMIGVTGRITRQDSGEEPKLKVEDVIPLAEAAARWSQSLRLLIPKQMLTEPLLDRLEKTFAANPGNCLLFIDLLGANGNIRTMRVGKYRVSAGSGLMQRLGELVGSDRIKLSA
jgi:DNA polymerase-3 subunit alpha